MESAKTIIIKKSHKKSTEVFDYNKLFKSLKKTCLSLNRPDGEAEQTARLVCDQVASWLKGKPEVTATDIRLAASKYLLIYNPEAAYLYQNYCVII